MIKGTGVDILDARRIEHLIQKHGERFIHRIFSKNEQKKAHYRSCTTLSFAKMFAAKEAFIKALGHSFSLHWVDIEILNNDLGKPFIKLSPKGHSILSKQIGPDCKIHLSLSDEPPYVIAFVVIDG